MGEGTQNVVATTPETAQPSSEVRKEEVEPVVLVEGNKEEKASEEKAVDVPEEEKTVEAVEESQEGKAETDRELATPTAEEAAASFKEESYYVKDLKESEKKALQDLKAKIEEAIKANSFLAAPKPEATKELEVEKNEAEVVAAEGPVEAKESAVAEREVPLDKAPAASTEPAPTEAASATEKTVPLAPPPEETVAEKEVVKEVATPVSEVSETQTETAGGTVLPPDAGTADEEAVDKSIRDVETEDLSPSLDDLSLWGVPLLQSKGGERSDVILLKFLRARDFKVNDAYGMLQDTLVWRKDFKADDLVEEDISNDYDDVAYMHGVDKEGHPVCYNHYGVFQNKELYQKTFEDETQFNNFLRWRIQVVEKSIQKLDFGANGVHSVVHIIDMKNSPGFAKRRNITKKAVTLLQDNYPELVAKQIFINVPWYFGALYNLHGEFVTPRSKSKRVVARPGKATETLFKYISPENVPVQYGGLSGLSKPDDTQFEGVEVKELIVKAGEKQSIEISVPESGSTIVWDIAVVGWEVVYGEEFVPSAEGSYTVIIQKSKKVPSSEKPLRNSFKAFESGKVVLNIDNAASRRKRLVVYRYLMKEAAPAPPPELATEE